MQKTVSKTWRKKALLSVLALGTVMAAPSFEPHGSGIAPFLSVLNASAHASRTHYAQFSKQQIQRMVAQEALNNGLVPPALALAVARVESNFQAAVRSHAGARGVMQIMPATAWGEFRVDAEQLWNPETNIRLGVSFLAQLYRSYGNRWDLALSHYNGGTLKKVGGSYVPHRYTRGYVQKVMTFWRTYQRQNLMAQLDVATKHSATAGTGISFHAAIERVNSRLNRGQIRKDAALARDYWLIEDAQGQRGWRDYLKVADRWLGKNAHEAEDGGPVFDVPTGNAYKPQPQSNKWQGRFQLDSETQHTPYRPRFN